MDWNFGSSDEVSDRFPSPESWSKWGISEPECLNFPNYGFPNLTRDELNFNGGIFSNDVEMESSTYDKDQSSSSIGGGLSEDSLQRTTLSSDELAHQLNGLARFDQMDDLFLSSLIQDFPGIENVQEPCCFETELQNDMVHDDNILTDMSLDTWSISSDTASIGSSKYLKTHAFSLSVEKDTASHFVPCNSGQKHRQLVTAPLVKVSVSSKHDGLNEQIDEETSLEESVLHEMENVMTQLTDKTRICFRDALYRLAKNSRQHVVPKKNQNSDLPKGTPPWTGQDEKQRPEGKKTMELETNTIDRAIASLMFNKMDSNMQDFPAYASKTSNQDILKEARSCNCSLNDPQNGLPYYQNFSRDAEVPILCQGYVPTRIS